MSVEHSPTKLRRICLVLAALVVVVFGVFAILLHSSANGRVFQVGDQVGFFGIGLLIAAAVLVFTRFRVRADETGIWVRNAVGERYFPWGVVVGIDIPDGATWAQMELHDDDTVGVLAIQTSDGDAAVDVVLALRQLLRSSQP